MRPHLDFFQCAVIRRVTVIPALRDRTLDAFVGMFRVHSETSFPHFSKASLPHFADVYSAADTRRIKQEVIWI